MMTRPRITSKLMLAAGAVFSLLLVSPVAAQQVEQGEEQLVEEIVAWVNDEVVMLSDLREAEQASIQQAMSSASDDQVAARIEQVKQRILLDQIWNRLLVQEAAQLFDIEMLKQDLIDNFMKSRQIESVEKLDSMLSQYGMSRDMLEDRLLLQAAPNYVIENRIRVNLGVSEAEAREFYQENLDRFSSEASVTFREIVLYARNRQARGDRREEAERIADEARGSDDFAALVEEYSEAPSSSIGGKIGPVNPGDLIETVRQAVMEGGPIGSVVGPVATNQGWHILLIEDRQESEVAPFEEVRSECEELCRQRKFEPAFQEFIGKLWDRSRIEVRRPYLDRIPQPWRETVVVRD
jgi:parvulin-like peptidyl-prolyl isomerase